MAYERGLAHDLRKIFSRAGRDAAAHVAQGDAQFIDHAASAYAGAIAQAIRARLQAVAEASAQLVVEELTGEKAAPGGLEVKFLSLFDVAKQSIADWLAHNGAAMVRRVTESIRRTIRGSLRRGNELNEPPRVLARRIRDDAAGEIGRARSEVIARTETHTAANVGSEAAASATGLQLVKEWGATEDQRTRPAHAKADGQTVEKDADFIVGGERLRFPGDPKGSAHNVINCRCVVLWKPKIPR